MDDHDPDIFSAYLHCVYFGADFLKDLASALGEGCGAEHADAADNKAADPEHDITPDEDADPEVWDDASDQQAGSSHLNDFGFRNRSEGDSEQEHEKCMSGTKMDIDWGDEKRDKFLIDLYLLADSFIDPVTANIAIDRLITIAREENKYPSRRLIEYVYMSTAAGSPLRRLLRDWHIHSVDYGWVDKLKTKEFPLEFLQDILREVWTLNKDNLDSTIRSVFETGFMNRPGERYHQKVDDGRRRSQRTSGRAH